MSRDEIQKLLGGYATGTLSDTERRELLEAALDDQELFDELAKEQALHDVLQDHAARRQLLAALKPARGWSWVRRPATLALVGGLATLLIVGGVVWLRPKPSVQPETTVAEALPPRQPAPLPAPAPAESVVRPALRRKLVRPPEAPAMAKLIRQEVAGGAKPVAAPPPPPSAPSPSAVLTAANDVANAPAQPPEANTVHLLDTLARAQAAAGAPAKATLPLEYHLLRAGPDGNYVPVAADGELHAGDSVRLQVGAPAAGSLQLYRRDPAGGLSLLAGQAVEKAQQYVLPASGGLTSASPARMELLLLLTPAEQPVMSLLKTREADQKVQGKVVRQINLDFR